jgi:hypothetical protein
MIRAAFSLRIRPGIRVSRLPAKSGYGRGGRSECVFGCTYARFDKAKTGQPYFLISNRQKPLQGPCIYGCRMVLILVWLGSLKRSPVKQRSQAVLGLCLFPMDTSRTVSSRRYYFRAVCPVTSKRARAKVASSREPKLHGSFSNLLTLKV